MPNLPEAELITGYVGYGLLRLFLGVAVALVKPAVGLEARRDGPRISELGALGLFRTRTLRHITDGPHCSATMKLAVSTRILLPSMRKTT